MDGDCESDGGSGVSPSVAARGLPNVGVTVHLAPASRDAGNLAFSNIVTFCTGSSRKSSAFLFRSPAPSSCMHGRCGAGWPRRRPQPERRMLTGIYEVKRLPSPAGIRSPRTTSSVYLHFPPFRVLFPSTSPPFRPCPPPCPPISLLFLFNFFSFYFCYHPYYKFLLFYYIIIIIIITNTNSVKKVMVSVMSVCLSVRLYVWMSGCMDGGSITSRG